MAYLRGQGAYGNQPVAVIFHDSNVYPYTNKSGEQRTMYFADVQLNTDPSVFDVGRYGPQASAHLYAERRTNPDGTPVVNEQTGEQRWSYTKGYSETQMKAMFDAARSGGKIREIFTREGEHSGWAAFLDVSLMPNSNGPGLIVNTKKPMSPSRYNVPELFDDWMKGQIERTQAAAAERRAQAQAQAAQAQAQNQVAGPAFMQPTQPGPVQNQAAGPDFSAGPAAQPAQTNAASFQAAAQAAAGQAAPAPAAPTAPTAAPGGFQAPNFDKPAAQASGPEL